MLLLCIYNTLDYFIEDTVELVLRHFARFHQLLKLD